jgi:uncharacterized membrane protein YobD (UPF0266 family)
MIQFIDFLKKRGREIRYLLYGTMAAIVVWSMTVDTSHAHTWALFGLVSCTVLIFFARWLASAGVEREEDFYDD